MSLKNLIETGVFLKNPNVAIHQRELHLANNITNANEFVRFKKAVMSSTFPTSYSNSSVLSPSAGTGER